MIEREYGKRVERDTPTLHEEVDEMIASLTIADGRKEYERIQDDDDNESDLSEREYNAGGNVIPMRMPRCSPDDVINAMDYEAFMTWLAQQPVKDRKCLLGLYKRKHNTY